MAADGVRRRDGASLQSLIDALAESKELKADVVADRDRRIQTIEKSVIESQQNLANARAALVQLQSRGTIEKVTAEQVTKAATAVTEAQQAVVFAQSARDKLLNDTAAYTTAIKKKTTAANENALAEQWGIIAEALSNKPGSIPSVLIGKTIGPINSELIDLCLDWEQQPMVLTPEMTLKRGDGTPYYMLSESAQWRCDTAMQLVLAKLGALKLVAIDRFDVLEADARGPFFDMLTRYAAENPAISVIVMGTLRKQPENMEGVRFWWVQDGAVFEKQPEEV